MELHSKLLQPMPEKARGWNERPLPFYMAHPGCLDPAREEMVLQDMEYLQQMYPADVKRYQRRIAQILDKTDYEGSMIYDEYPDRWQMYKLAQDILERIKRQEAKDNPGAEIPKEKWEWASDMVQIILFYEVYKRRHNNHSGILKF